MQAHGLDAEEFLRPACMRACNSSGTASIVRSEGEQIKKRGVKGACRAQNEKREGERGRNREDERERGTGHRLNRALGHLRVVVAAAMTGGRRKSVWEGLVNLLRDEGHAPDHLLDAGKDGEVGLPADGLLHE